MLRKETIHSFFQTLFGFRKARSPLHIVLIALVHLLAWSLLFLLPLPLYPSRTNFPEFLERELIDKLMLIPCLNAFSIKLIRSMGAII